MSPRKTLLAIAVVMASAGPAFADDSGAVFLGNVEGWASHEMPGAERTRAQVANELAQAQQRAGVQYLPIGEGSSYPPAAQLPRSGRMMTHRGAEMPSGHGMMPDHPHQGPRR